jgi:SAM-dependent methyltransferase
MKTLKELFIAEAVREVVEATPGRGLRILDLGCGTAFYVPALLQKFPTVTYIGVEPIAESFAQAEKNLAGVPRAKVHFQLGYDSIAEAEASFDLVFSLSVLEHIKHLDRFIALSAKYLAVGGTMVHRYDLGHALYPHSLKERLHVCMGNHIPKILPERQFVRYVGDNEVRKCYERFGVTPTKTTYHQMRDAKSLEKKLGEAGEKAVKELFEWEMKHQSLFQTLSLNDREHLFPAVAVWGVKKGK